MSRLPIETEITETTIDRIAESLLTINSMTHKKLQKLCYYAYSWFLTLYGRKLFENRFEAWIHGPVDPILYQQYREWGWQEIPKRQGHLLNEDLYEFITQVYDSYGHLNGDELEYLSHTEEPWLEARNGLPEYEPSNKNIKDDVIRSFYMTVLQNEQRD